MVSDQLATKTLQVGRGDIAYQYLWHPPGSTQNPTLAFFHGFPSTVDDWRHQLEYFSDQGFGVIAPDMLGYGGSSKPDDVSAYVHRDMAEDMIKILDHEHIDRFHGISHDFGSHLMSRLYCFNPQRLLSLTFISVPFTPPGVPFDLAALNRRMKSLIGMEKFAYMEFLASSDSPAMVEAHVSGSITRPRCLTDLSQLESFHSLIYEQDANWKADNFYPPGKLEAWLTSDRRGRHSIVDKEERGRWLTAFRSGGLRGPTNWYRALLDNVHLSEESSALSAGHITTELRVPVLAIDSQPDNASVPGFLEAAMKDRASQLSVKLVDAQGHWPHIVAYNEVNKLIERHVSLGM